MSIFDSPFYILGATPYDNRRKIVELADERSIFSGTERVEAARSILTTPSKRLHAEVRWFPSMSSEETDEIVNYCVALHHGQNADEPEISEVGTLATLNMKLYTFQYKQFSDVSNLKYSILEISRLYANINVDVLQDELNNDRSTSGFPQICNVNDISDELGLYRGEFRKDVLSQLMNLPQEQYIELVTCFSEKYSTTDDHNYGQAILEDIINDYELQMTPEIERQKEHIDKLVSDIEDGTTESSVSEAVTDLIALVISWDILAQPLQLVARGRGQTHGASEDVAHEIRELAVTLHNEFGKTNEALLLTEALKKSFAELPDFSELIGEDIGTLNKLKQEQEAEAQEEQESKIRNRMDKMYSVTSCSDSVIIPPYCTCCMKRTSTTEEISTSISEQSGNRKTTRTISLEMPVCSDCLEHRKAAKNAKWFIVLISVIIAMVSFKLASDLGESQFVIPFFAATISYVGLGFAVRLHPLGVEHSTRGKSVWLTGINMTGNTTTFNFTNWRYAKLFAEVNQIGKFYGNTNGKQQAVLEINYPNKAKSRSFLKAVDSPILGGILVLVFTSIFVIALYNMNPSNSTSPTATTSQGTETSTSQTSTTTPNRSQKLAELETKLASLKSEISNMEDQLTSIEVDIEYYKTMYDDTNDSSYADLYNDAVDEYNSLWAEYDQAVDDYNDMVKEHNSLLN